MCTARVMLASGALSYNLPGQPQGGVCRKLFAEEAPADRTSLYAALQARLEEQHVRQSEHWNFDFRTETPLPGRYQWVRPDSHQRVPSNGSRVVVEEVPSTSRKPLVTTQLKITDFLHFRKRPRSNDSSHKLKLARMDISGYKRTSTTTRPMASERTSAS